MMAMERRGIDMFVDKARPQHWVVRDREGNFWIVPPVENAWEKREQFQPTEETSLEPVPGHYLYLLGLPG
jgi:hypothetical protein